MSGAETPGIYRSMHLKATHLHSCLMSSQDQLGFLSVSGIPDTDQVVIGSTRKVLTIR